MNNRVTVIQAKRLKRELAFSGKSTGYVCNGIIVEDVAPENYNSKKSIISLPKCDEVIEWLWDKYGVSIIISKWFDGKTYFNGYVDSYNSPAIVLGIRNIVIYGNKKYCDINACKRNLISKAISFILKHNINRLK